MARKRCQKERLEQTKLVTWFYKAYPHHKLIVSANGGSRNLLEAINLKNSGVVAGVPDIFIPVPNKSYPGLWIEFKPTHTKGTRKTYLSKEQKVMLEYLSNQGYMALGCWGFTEASKVINHYMQLE